MLQFNRSETTNTNAVWIDTVDTSSGYYGNLRIIYTQSYDLSNGNFDVATISAPNAYRNWLVISNSGSVAPTASGQYDISIYTLDTGSGNSTWESVSTTFQATSDTWQGIGGITPVDLIYSDRAYVSGSNEQEITQYVSSNENGTYITYNG